MVSGCKERKCTGDITKLCWKLTCIQTSAGDGQKRGTERIEKSVKEIGKERRNDKGWV